MVTDLVWKKPVACIYRERYPNMENEPFAVIKTKKIAIKQAEDKSLTGSILDFFALMGDVDYISSPEGAKDKYVVCWFDDTEEDTNKDMRRLTGVTFPKKITFTLTESGKRTYNANFIAAHGKLK